MTTTNESNNGHDHIENPSAFDQDAYPSHDAAQPGPGADLSAFDDDYAEAEAPEFDEVPDGKYQVRVHTVKFARSQKNDPMIKWDTVIISGQHAGRHIFKNSVITQSSLPFVKADLQTLGLKLEKFSELPNHLDALLDLTIGVTKRTKGEYANVYFNKLLNIPPGIGGDAGGGIDLSKEPAPF
ncbi:MAG: DUF669 domain-containing protein [Phycisphaera sp.]|nr:DUF669 domain-containing protein [Phycisphaera sp.]